jgi:hypothetical protein
MGLVSAWFVFALSSCEIPSSVRIKSSPSLYLPLGSPFGGGDSLSLNQYLSVGELKNQLGGNVDIVEWDASPLGAEFANVQAYRVRYPVADINMDLSQYVQELDAASKLASEASEGWIPSVDGRELIIPLPLDSMSFASNVTDVVIKVTLSFKDSDAGRPGADKSMPAGVEVRFSGKAAGGTPSGNTWSSPKIPVFNPVGDDVSITVTGVPAGTWFKPALGFEWVTADISLGSSKSTDHYELDFSKFSGFMGKGISFKKVTGYLYIKKPSNATANVTTTLTWRNPVSAILIDPVPEALNWNTFTPPAANFEIDFTRLFDSPLTFDYTLDLQKVTVTSTGHNGERLAVDLVILLPLEFTLDTGTVEYNGNSYRKLELEMLSDMSGEGSGDLLGREEGEDGMFSGLKSVKVFFSKYTNTIIGGLAVGIKTRAGAKLVDFATFGEKGEGEIELTEQDIAYPFNPKFELLVPAADTLKVLKPEAGKDGEIDFSIAVRVDTDLDYPIEF